MQSCLADLGRANGHGLGNMEGDGGVVSDGFVVKFGALPLCEAYDERHRSRFTLTSVHVPQSSASGRPTRVCVQDLKNGCRECHLTCNSTLNFEPTFAVSDNTSYIVRSKFKCEL